MDHNKSNKKVMIKDEILSINSQCPEILKKLIEAYWNSKPSHYPTLKIFFDILIKDNVD